MKAKNYREVKGRPYTRKEYIRSLPDSKITKFTMGNAKKEFSFEARLVSREGAQVQSNALEAARIASNRHLSTKLGDNYFLRVMPYPHSILRENKMIFGAHADRLQDGMRNAFGKSMGRAARVKNDQSIIVVGVDEDSVATAKRALELGKAKLPMPCRVIVEKNEDESGG